MALHSKLIRWLRPGLALLAVAGFPPAAAAVAPPPSAGADTNLASFIRFEPGRRGEGKVQTAIKTYRHPNDGSRVTLVAVVHVADRAYYEKLQKRLDDFDALLYEMIRDRDVDPAPAAVMPNPVSQFQLGLTELLDLEFQLSCLDYNRTNFVHADLDPATFLELQRDRGESILGLMFHVALEEQGRLDRGEGSSVNSFDLLRALLSPQRAYALKLVLGRQMGELEAMIAGLDQGRDGAGSVLVSARNAHAIEVLQAQRQAGKRNFGILYGAGHMPDLARRLESLGYERSPTLDEWLTAWDIRPRKSTGKRPAPAPASAPTSAPAVPARPAPPTP